MTADIANIIKPYLLTLPFADTVAGLVKTAIIEDEVDGKLFKKSFPISCDVTYTDCIKGKYTNLVPNKSKKSIMYFEDGGSSITDVGVTNFSFQTKLKLIGWLNLAKLGKENCSLSALALAHVMKVLPVGYQNTGMFQRLRIFEISQDIKSNAIFSKYSYKEETVQYLMYPYDYFALNEVDRRVEESLTKAGLVSS